MKLPAYLQDLVAETVVLVSILGILAYMGAPGWALVLACFVSTRSSRLALANDRRALQSTLQAFRQEWHDHEGLGGPDA